MKRISDGQEYALKKVSLLLHKFNFQQDSYSKPVRLLNPLLPNPQVKSLTLFSLSKVKMGKLTEKEKQNALNEVRILASIQ